MGNNFFKFEAESTFGMNVSKPQGVTDEIFYHVNASPVNTDKVFKVKLKEGIKQSHGQTG